MREIKFRAYEKSLKEIIPVANIDFNKQMINTKSAWRFFEEIELMQYTGLKDMNGVEIYEGDVLSKYGHPSRKIIFENGCFVGMSTDVVQALSWKPGKLKSLIELHFKVVGNIYENPELLEGDTK